MYSSINNFLIIIFLLIILISCQKNHNTNGIQEIQNLEKVIQNDKNNLEKINTSNIEKTIKIAEFNLLKLEKQQLDSLRVELIYFKYISYLRCVNSIKSSLEKIQNLKKLLHLNTEQINKIKLDYINSKTRRIDLDKYLLEESRFVKSTSEQIQQMLKLITYNTEQFDSLNRSIEIIVNEK